MRISLVILGIVLIAGIWFAHRARGGRADTRRSEELADWGDDEVHIRAGADDPAVRARGADAEPEPGWADPLEPARPHAPGVADEPDFGGNGGAREGRREPSLGVTSGQGEPARQRGGDRVQDIYGVLDNDDEPVVAPPPHGAFDRPAGPRTGGGRRSAAGGAERARRLLDDVGGRVRAGLDALHPARLRGPRAKDTLGERLDPDHEVDPDLIEKPEPDMESLGEYVSEPRVVGRNADEPRLPEREEKILLLHVVAPRNRPFTGVALGAALQRAGLTPGPMDIYHFHEPETDRREPLFSVANMVPPGTLREEDLADMMTPGVTLFSQVHRSAQPQRAFEALLENANILARDLGGSILDAQQSTATNQTLAYMREDLNAWLMRNRPDLLRRRRAR